MKKLLTLCFLIAALRCEALPYILNTNGIGTNTQFFGGTGSVKDYDAAIYVNNLTNLSPYAASRVEGFYVAMKQYGLWTNNFVDGAVLGTNLNYGGGNWQTVRHSLGNNSGSPTILNYGEVMSPESGTPAYAYMHGLPDCRTNTIILIVSQLPTSGFGEQFAFVEALQNPTDGRNADGMFIDTFRSSVHAYWNTPGNTSGSSNYLSMIWQGATPEEHTYVMQSDGKGTVLQFPEGAGNSLCGSQSPTNLAAGFSIGSPLNSLNLGCALTTDTGVPTNTMSLGGTVTVHAFLLFNTNLNMTQIRQAMTALRWLDLRPNNIIFGGDSLVGEEQSQNIGLGYAQSLEYQYMNGSNNLAKSYFYRTVGRIGYTSANWCYSSPSGTISGGANGLGGLECLSTFGAFPGGPVNTSTLFWEIAANDIQTDQPQSWTIPLANVKNMCAGCGSNGYGPIYIFNMRPSTNVADGFTGAQLTAIETNRIAYNMALLTNGPLGAKILDWDALFPTMDQSGASARWSADGLHSTAYGNFLAAVAIPSMISGALNSIDGETVQKIYNNLLVYQGGITIGQTSAVPYTLAAAGCMQAQVGVSTGNTNFTVNGIKAGGYTNNNSFNVTAYAIGAVSTVMYASVVGGTNTPLLTNSSSPFPYHLPPGWAIVSASGLSGQVIFTP